MDPLQNDSFGSLSNNHGEGVFGGQTTLNGSTKKGSRKWVIILTAGIFFIIVGVIFAILSNENINNENNDALVNRYVNLLMVGENNKERYDGNFDILSLIENEDEEEVVQNIYTSPRMFAYGSEESIFYYDKLKEALDKIEGIENTYEGWGEIAFLAEEAKDILPRYFVATFLAYTDASYNYFIEHRNFNNFLSEYNFPFDTSRNIFDDIINELFNTNKDLYEEILKTGCIMFDGVNYECLDASDNERIKLLQFDSMTLSNEVRNIASELLDSIVYNAKELTELMEKK